MCTWKKQNEIMNRSPRKEDIRHITGHASFVDDIKLPKTAHCYFVRSNHAYAQIKKIDTDVSRSAKGVLQVLTAGEVSPFAKPVPVVVDSPRLRVNFRPLSLEPLASKVVRHVGQPVVAVIASERYSCEDAVELVNVEYEPLDPIMSTEEALRPEPRIVYESWKDNVFIEGEIRTGDVDKVLRESDHVFKETLRVHRHTVVPLETRGCIADYDPRDNSLRFYSSTQSVFPIRDILADSVALPK
jgi:carbon-monoxide dehydrogenase large subunit